MKRSVKVLLLVLLVAATAAVTFSVTYNELEAANSSAATSKVNEISQYLDRYFIDDYDETTLADGAAAGMIAATGDEWSYYISAADYAKYMERMNNAYVGIGVTIQEDQNGAGFAVTTVTPGGPAALAGIQSGDILTKVEGEDVLTLGRDETVNRVRGEEGTKIRLTFVRDGQEFEVELVRSNIDTPVATTQTTYDNIAVITIRNFDSHCADETVAAIDNAVAQGAKGIVFDVRNNPGGLKTELVKILDRLLPEGALFRSRDYAGNESVDHSDANHVELPMAVLVNADSYSAAEFFAAAMQEYHAATIVGVQTYGKGNFQNTFRLSDGSAIAISVGKYFTPNGVSLTGVGITPDVLAEMSDEENEKLYYEQLPMEKDPQMAAALEALR